MTDGSIVRLAKAVQVEIDGAVLVDGNALSAALADLAGPCGTCGGTGRDPSRPERWACKQCHGTGTDPLAAAREADRLPGGRR